MSVFRLHTAQGIIGPVKLETVRDLIDSGVVGADALVSRDTGPFMSISAVAELASLLKSDDLSHEPQYAGDVGVVSYFRLLHRLFGEHAVGLLSVRDATRRKDIYLEAGQPVFVASTMVRERLGDFLVSIGRISGDQQRTAVDEARQNSEPLGATLVRLGTLTDVEMRDLLREQQMVRLIDLCTWEHGRYAYFAGKRYEGPRIDLRVDSTLLWVRAARAVSDTVVVDRLGETFRKPILSLDSTLLMQCSAHLASDERLAVALFDGKRSAADVLQAESGNAARRRAALTILYLFAELGGLRLPQQS